MTGTSTAVSFFESDINTYNILYLYLCDSDVLALAQCSRALRPYESFLRSNKHSPSIQRYSGKTYCYSRKRFHRFIAKQKRLETLQIEFKDLRTAKPNVWKSCGQVKKLVILENWNVNIRFLRHHLQSDTFKSLTSFIDYSVLKSGATLSCISPSIMSNIRHLHITNDYGDNNVTDKVTTFINNGTLVKLESLILQACSDSLFEAILKRDINTNLTCLQFSRIQSDAFKSLCEALENGLLPKLHNLYASDDGYQYLQYESDETWYSNSFTELLHSICTRHNHVNQTPLEYLHLGQNLPINTNLFFVQSEAFRSLRYVCLSTVYDARDGWFNTEEAEQASIANQNEFLRIFQTLDLSDVTHLATNFTCKPNDYQHDLFRAQCENQTLRNLKELIVNIEGPNRDYNPFTEMVNLQNLQNLERLSINLLPSDKKHRYFTLESNTLPKLRVLELGSDNLTSIIPCLCAMANACGVLQRLHLTIHNRRNRFDYVSDSSNSSDSNDSNNTNNETVFCKNLLALLQNGHFPCLQFFNIDNAYYSYDYHASVRNPYINRFLPLTKVLKQRSRTRSRKYHQCHQDTFLNSIFPLLHS
jgi:hypothetical protein